MAGTPVNPTSLFVAVLTTTMATTTRNVQAFKSLCKEHFGRELNDLDAAELLVGLVRFVELSYKPMTQEQMRAVIQRRRELGFGTENPQTTQVLPVRKVLTRTSKRLTNLPTLESVTT